MSLTLLHGDCLDVLATLPAESIDACVTDPPYGIGFMGREWDTFKPGYRADAWEGYDRQPKTTAALHAGKYDRSASANIEFQRWTEGWAREVLRVLKPGAHILVCGAPRSYHRMASGLEDAGFEIRDCLAWLFGSGFPKSLNLGEGLGTALKPAYEPIVLARKPFKGTVKANVEKFGTGALNIDASRIEGADGDYDHPGNDRTGPAGNTWNAEACGFRNTNQKPPHDLGRWPANVCLDEHASKVLDEQSGESVSSGQSDSSPSSTPNGYGPGDSDGWSGAWHKRGQAHEDIGGASRFYYVAKPSREERDYGCRGLAQRTAGECTDRTEGSAGLTPRAGAGRTGGGRNFHPTVKPVELMRWLVKLVTPINGVVLDPFLGSGTTGMACRYEQRGFIGIEREADYLAIAEARIAAVAPLFGMVEVGTSVAAVDPQVGSTPSRPRATDLFRSSDV